MEITASFDAGKKEIVISPSLICADMLNLEKNLQDIRKLGIESLHIDIIDGHFSPSLPLGTELLKALRQKTDLFFDVHIMATQNEPLIGALLEIGVQSICFHYESERHVERMLQLIKNSGVKAGIALNPATPFSMLEYVIDRCDYILLMLISPGYAGSRDEKMVPYALEKIKKCRHWIDQLKVETKIIVDGRISGDVIAEIVAKGADILVSGSTGLFKQGVGIDENMKMIEEEISKGLLKRKEHFK